MTTDLPILSLFSIEDLERHALAQTLIANGVEDPATFLEENSVAYKCILKGNVGLAVTITRISAKKKKGQLPTEPGK